MLAVARHSRLIVGCRVLKRLYWAAMQEFVDWLRQAARYCSNGLALYGELMRPLESEHVASVGKEQTHTIESLIADLRTDLWWLKRRSRCSRNSGRHLPER